MVDPIPTYLLMGWQIEALPGGNVHDQFAKLDRVTGAGKAFGCHQRGALDARRAFRVAISFAVA